MHLAPSPEDQAFREEVRAFARANVPAEIARRVELGYHPLKEDLKRWNTVLFEKGWIAPNWPKEYGGPGWTPTQRNIFSEEMSLAFAPPPSTFGLNLVGPVIYTFGTQAQKDRYLPKILSGEEFWCQGYSEPGSGSDLASLKTRAVNNGDHYLVNGSKLWTTEAHYADWLFCLVRTNPDVKAQEGISFLLIDMNDPGIRVRPVVTFDEGHSVNEVFLDDVKVPAENLIGEENKGWTIAKFLLGNERTHSARVGVSKRDIQRLKEIAAVEMMDGRPLIEDPSFRERLAKVEIELIALEYSVMRVLSEETAGRDAGPISSFLKVRGSELRQAISELMIEALGENAAIFYADPSRPDLHKAEADNLPPVGPEHGIGIVADHLFRRAATIYGGTNEIQRSIIAKQVLGL